MERKNESVITSMLINTDISYYQGNRNGTWTAEWKRRSATVEDNRDRQATDEDQSDKQLKHCYNSKEEDIIPNVNIVNNHSWVQKFKWNRQIPRLIFWFHCSCSVLNFYDEMISHYLIQKNQLPCFYRFESRGFNRFQISLSLQFL